MDSDGGKVGESAEDIDGQGLGADAREGSALDHLAHGDVGIELVEDGFFAEQLAHVRGFGPGHAQEPGEGSEDESKNGLKVELGVASARNAGDELVEAGPRPEAVREESVEKGDEGGEHEQHDAYVGGHFEAVGGSVGDGLEPVALALDLHVGEVDDRLGLGHKHLGYPQGGGGVHDRGGEQVAGKKDLAFGV